MKRHIYYILTFLFLSLLISCDNLNYNQGYNNGKQAGYSQGHQAGYSEGYTVGFAEGLSKSSEGIVLFDSVNPNLWKIVNWISIIAILISLIIVVWIMIFANDGEEKWRKIVAKILVILLSLLVSYLVIPKINFIWFFNPMISSLTAYIVYIIAISGVFFIGKFLVDLFYRKTEIGIEILIIFIASFFIWFMSYLLLNNKYLLRCQNNYLSCTRIFD